MVLYITVLFVKYSMVLYITVLFVKYSMVLYITVLFRDIFKQNIFINKTVNVRESESINVRLHKNFYVEHIKHKKKQRYTLGIIKKCPFKQTNTV